MTRVLSELLGAREPYFQQSLKQLEILAGHPQADIRLSDDIHKNMRAKLHELGLDKADTTGEELYSGLGARLQADEERFARALQGVSPDSDDPIAHVAQALERQITPRTCFALKSAAAKKILKANLPRKTMKALGYRSADSMLKHETAASLYAAAWLIESGQWAKRIVSAYSKLQASDFEQRQLSIEHPTSKRWQALGDSVVAARKHNVLSFKELGAVVLLPLPTERPQLATLTTAVLALHAVNEIRAAGTFLKLHQVQSNFGTIVQQVVMGEPQLATKALDTPMSWHGLHQYFARFGTAAKAEIFHPVLAAEELAWNSVEDVIVRIEPAMEFWKQTSHLALLQRGQPTSCNLTDALLSHCNQLPYASRAVHHFRESLRSELLLRYLSHDKLEQTVLGNLQHQFELAPEMARI